MAERQFQDRQAEPVHERQCNNGTVLGTGLLASIGAFTPALRIPNGRDTANPC